MNHLADFFQSLSQTGRTVHYLNTQHEAKYVKFSGNLAVYFDNQHGYDILRLTDISHKATEHERHYPGLPTTRP